MARHGRAHRLAGMRLHVITGKGGTGKTTVAAALALALATDGRRVLLAEVEGRQGIAQLFDTPPLPYEERKVAVAPGGGDVYALAVDAEDALLEYLEMFYNMKRAGRALKRFGAIDFATTIAPGMRDVLLTGKVVEATKRRDKQIRPTYDAVVLDAPPTGRIVRFLNVNAEVAGLARVGPIRHHADSVMSVLRSAQTAVHIATILEEMPVQETADGITQLQAAGLPLGGIVINMVSELLYVDTILDDKSTRIIVCCGAGGVGKTTTAAALALRAAERGRNAVVLTIDPARRLAQSMGLTELDNTPRVVAGINTEAGG